MKIEFIIRNNRIEGIRGIHGEILSEFFDVFDDKTHYYIRDNKDNWRNYSQEYRPLITIEL